mgnify:FL=1
MKLKVKIGYQLYLATWLILTAFIIPSWITYSGNDVLRVTVNKSQITRTNTDASGTRHYVIDFPTSAANGTFKSIYWVGGSNNESTAQKYIREVLV